MRIRAFTNNNPHDVASDAQGSFPSGDCFPLGVSYHHIENGEITGGTIEFGGGDLTPEQEAWLKKHPNVGPYYAVDVD